MSSLNKGTPGPIARNAFRTGMIVAVIAGLSAIIGLYVLSGSPLVAAYIGVFLFPVYLVFAASLLNTWLGYGGDVAQLQRVTRPAGDTDNSDDTQEETTPSEGESVFHQAAEYFGGIGTDPRFHVVVTLAALGVAAGFGAAGQLQYTILVLMLAAVLGMIVILNHLQPRLQTAYQNRNVSRDVGQFDDPGSAPRVTPTTKADLSVAALITLLLLAITAIAEVFA